MLHSIHHPGVRATWCLIIACFCWPQMAITLMARACLFCQRGKVNKHVHVVHLQPAEILVPHRRFAHIHVDLVSLLPPSHEHTYLLAVIDTTSRWPEAISLPAITTADCTRPEPSSPAGSPGSECRPPLPLTEGRSAQIFKYDMEIVSSLVWCVNKCRLCCITFHVFIPPVYISTFMLLPGYCYHVYPVIN